MDPQPTLLTLVLLYSRLSILPAVVHLPSVPLLHICLLSQTVMHLMILPTHSRWLKPADTENSVIVIILPLRETERFLNEIYDHKKELRSSDELHEDFPNQKEMNVIKKER